MVLYNALNEKLNSTLLKGDEGKYLEERALLNQLAVFVSLEPLYEMIIKQNHELTKEEMIEFNNKLWNLVEYSLYDILDSDMTKDFKETFEAKPVVSLPSNRIAELQDAITMFFMEILKRYVLDEIITKEQADIIIKRYEEELIKPGSAVLDVPENNIGLDESLDFFNTKKGELYSIVDEKSVK